VRRVKERKALPNLTIPRTPWNMSSLAQDRYRPCRSIAPLHISATFIGILFEEDHLFLLVAL